MKPKISKFVETRFEVRVRRHCLLQPPVTIETVGPYLAKLLASQKRIEDIDFDAENVFGCGKEQIDERKKALQEEINHCRFFLAMAKKVKEADFGKWLFIPAEPNEWQRRHDTWVLDNGKLVAKIEIIPTASRTKLRMYMENASLATECGLDFTPMSDLVRRYGQMGRETHAYEKKERIAEEIEASKNELGTLLANTIQPRYLLNDLL